MRAYAPVSAEELSSLLSQGSITPQTIFYLTPEYVDENPDLDEEECEYELSLQAARSAIGDGDFGLVIAAEVGGVGPITKAQLECVFECVQIDDEPEIELIWYGPSEVDIHLPAWSAR